MADNLVMNPGFLEMDGGLPAGWRTACPRDEVSPSFTLAPDPESKIPCLRSDFPHGLRTHGQWETIARGIEPGETYSVSVEARWDGVDNPREAIQLKVAWLESPEADSEIRKEFTGPPHEASDIWRRLVMKTLAPEVARCARLELVSRWSRQGKVLWRNPSVVKTERPSSRPAKLAVVSCPRAGTLDENRANHVACAKSAGDAGADLVLLTEAFPRSGTGLSMLESSEPLEGPTFQAMAKAAIGSNAYIAGGIDEMDSGTLRNTMLLVAPDGTLVGRYRKTHLPEAECIGGCTPGDEYPVFETPLGRIGMEICYDNFFPEVARSLAVNGAEIILCAIAGDGREGGMNWDVVTRARAIDNCAYFAASIWHPARSLIVDPWGHVLADSAGEEGFFMAEVDLSVRKWCPWLSVSCEGEWRRLWRNERRPSSYGDLQ